MSSSSTAITVHSLSWVRERVAYSADTLCELFGVPSSERASLITDLQAKRIINRRGFDNIGGTEDAEPLESYITGADYSFLFVGMYCRAGYMVCVLPKYANAELLKVPDQGDFHRPCPAARRVIFSQVLKAVRRYKHSAQHELPENQQDSEDSNYLSLLVSLLSDFVENGVYRDNRTTDTLNARGRILWPATIHKTNAVLQEGGPVYPDVVTRKTEFEPQHPITLLHRRIAGECYRCLHDLGLIDLLDLPVIEDEEVQDSYDATHMLYLVESELNVQFDSRRRYILTLLREYLFKQSRADSAQVEEYAFGCSSFNLLWEDACRSVLGHDYSRLWSILPPDWHFADRTVSALKSLEPDIIISDEKDTCILDAKYYLPMESGTGMPSGLPGIESVTKQFLYQQALLNSDSVEPAKGRIVPPIYNAFLMPLPQSVGLDDRTVSYYATITMPLFPNMEIIVLRISPNKLLSCYSDNISAPYFREFVWLAIRENVSSGLPPEH